jgi:hypothetical protein
LMKGLWVTSPMEVVLSMAFPLHISPLMFHEVLSADILHFLNIEFITPATSFNILVRRIF